MKLFRQAESYISEKMKIHGDVDSEANIIIDGEVHGNVRSQKSVMLGSTARFEGNIECETALICGYMKGRIVARRMLEVKIPATIVGDLVSASVRLDPGVVFQGKILTTAPDKAPMAQIEDSKRADKQLFDDKQEAIAK